MPLPHINIPWVGLPTTDGVQDTAFVKEIGQQLVNAGKGQQIKFWCLEDFAPHYKQVFHTYPNIAVVVIEEQCVEDTKMRASVKLIKDSGLEKLEWVIGLKSTLTLFILAYHGGYVLDANIIGKGNSLELLNYEKSMIQTREGVPIGHGQEFECQIQFAPQTGSVNQWALDAANYCNDELQSRVSFLKNNEERLGQLKYMRGEEFVIQLKSLQGLGVRGMHQVINQPGMRENFAFMNFVANPIWKGACEVVLPGEAPIETRTLLKFCCKSYCLNRRNNYLPPIYFMVANYKDHPQFLKITLRQNPQLNDMRVSGDFRLRTKEQATKLENYTLFDHAKVFCPEAIGVLQESTKEQQEDNAIEKKIFSLT